MTQAQKERNQRNLEFIRNYSDKLTEELQLWKDNTMLTAQLPRSKAIEGIQNGTYFIITTQAVGFLNELWDGKEIFYKGA